jgi:hypothetical protein
MWKEFLIYANFKSFIGSNIENNNDGIDGIDWIIDFIGPDVLVQVPLMSTIMFLPHFF